MCFSLQQIRRINISRRTLSRDKDRQSRLSWYLPQSATAPFLLAPGKKLQCVIQLRGSLLASCSPLSSRLMPEQRGGQGGLPRHCPPRQSTVGGFVGGGISPSPLALSAASAASSQYLSAYSANPPTWTTSLNWLPPYKLHLLNDLWGLATETTTFLFHSALSRKSSFADDSYVTFILLLFISLFIFGAKSQVRSMSLELLCWRFVYSLFKRFPTFVVCTSSMSPPITGCYCFTS